MPAPTPQSRAHRLWQTAVLLATRISAHRISESAGALTYLTLFAIVPALTVSYSIIAALPQSEALADHVQQFLLSQLMPEASGELQTQLGDFARQARNLTGFGLAGLLLTGLFLLRGVEQAFERIWLTGARQRTLRSVLMFWGAVLLVPLLLGLGLALTTLLLSVRHFALLAEMPVVSSALGLLPWAISSLGFALLYRFLPRTPVRWRDALAGGLFAALLFELAKYLFAWAAAKTSYALIYGAFAAVPLFLLWVHTTWMILLTGAEIAALLGLNRVTTPRT